MTSTETEIVARFQARAADAGDQAAGESVKIAGVGYTGRRIRVPRFPDGVVVDLAQIQIAGEIPIVVDHSSDLSSRLGSASGRVVENQLLIEGQLIGGAPIADRAVQLARAGGLSLSIQTVASRIEQIRSGEVVRVNGQDHRGPVSVARSAELVEVSAVGIGADRDARAVAASYKDGTTMEHEEDQNTETDPVLLERQRIGEIHAAFEGLGDRGRQEAKKLVEEGASIEDARGRALEVLRASRPAIGAGGVSRAPQAPDRDVLAASILTMGGAGDAAERNFDERTLEASEGLARRSGTLLALARHAIESRGDGSSPDDVDATIRASFSTDSLGGAIAEAIRVAALDAFQRAPEAWRRIADRRSTPDFREQSLTRLAGSLKFESVAPSGELKHGALDAEQTKIRAGTKGAILTISRQTIVDDSASQLLAQLPRELALEAARSVGDDLAVLLDDDGGTFFNAGNGNLLDGVESALSIQSLSSAIELMRLQTDSSGRAINFAPSSLLVSPADESVARQILNSTELRRATTPDADPASGRLEAVANPHRNVASLEVDARVTPGEWFLFAEPASAAVVVLLLNGSDAPTVESLPPAPDVLGRTYRAFFDYGVGLHETRAAVKSAGQ